MTGVRVRDVSSMVLVVELCLGQAPRFQVSFIIPMTTVVYCMVSIFHLVTFSFYFTLPLSIYIYIHRYTYELLSAVTIAHN